MNLNIDQIQEKIDSLRFSDDSFVELLYLINKAKDITINKNGNDRSKNNCLNWILMVEEREINDFKDKRDKSILSIEELDNEFFNIQSMVSRSLNICIDNKKV